MGRYPTRTSGFRYLWAALVSHGIFIALCFFRGSNEVFPLCAHASAVLFLFVANAELVPGEFPSLRASAGLKAERSLRSGLIYLSAFLLSGSALMLVVETTDWQTEPIAWPVVRYGVALTVAVTGSIAGWKLFQIPAYIVEHNHRRQS